MTWEEAIKFCEEHECEECPMVKKRTEYQKTVLFYPCCWNLVDKEITDHVGESTKKVYNDDLYEDWMFFDKGETE